MIEVAEGVGVRVVEVFFSATESSVRVFFSTTESSVRDFFSATESSVRVFFLLVKYSLTTSLNKQNRFTRSETSFCCLC